MSIPPEVLNPVKDFLKAYGWIIVITVVALFIGYTSVAFLGKNNPVEIAVEQLIQKETGVALDLTPSK